MKRPTRFSNVSLKADRVATRVCESRHTKNRFISLVLSVLCLLSNECWSEPHLREVAKESGVEFTHLSGREGELWTVEITGAGVGVLDYDNDGKLDIYAIQGGPLRDRSGLLPSDRIYRNTSVEGELKFEDLTEATGIASIATQYGMGIATGDIDSDGDVDVFLANFGKNQLLENVDGVFVDISDESDFGEETWSISASFGDYNDDGLLDLYVANYLNFPEFDSYRPCRRLSTRLSYCAPSNFSPVEDRLYLNNGDGKFIDYTEQSGISSVAKPGMGVV
ncbi:MAG: VCBS repeat-containing protein, partial [Gammaproteobacteria bacterium]|nr:VCBS repeat-containing protein [Gammaproteobacteria bacterium]